MVKVNGSYFSVCVGKVIKELELDLSYGGGMVGLSVGFINVSLVGFYVNFGIEVDCLVVFSMEVSI